MNPVKISEVALEAGKSIKAALSACEALNISVRPPHKSVTHEEAERIVAFLVSGAKPASKPAAPKKKAAPAPRIALLKEAESRESLLRGYTKNNPPKWPCPRCGRPLRLMAEKRIVIRQSAANTFWQGTFSDTFECTAKSCGQIVSVAGEAEDWHNAAPRNTQEVLPNFYYPKQCTPPLSFFALPGQTPRAVAQAIGSSFEQFFQNPKAATDALRAAQAALIEAEGGKLDAGFKTRIEKIRFPGEGKGQGKTAKEDLLKLYAIFEEILNALYAPQKGA